MKITLDLPDEIIREMESLAIVQGRPLDELVADLLRQALGMPSSGSMVEIGGNGLPMIRCRPDALASQTSVEELLQLEQQFLTAIEAFRGQGQGGTSAQLLADRRADAAKEA